MVVSLRMLGVLLYVALVAPLGLLAHPRQSPQEKVRVPDVDARRTLRAEVREIFKADYAKTDPARRKALGEKLLVQALATKSDLVSRFVLLTEAKDVAAKAGDPKTALSAAEVIYQEFIGMWISRPVMEIDILEQAELAEPSKEDKIKIARFYLQVAERASREKNFFPALKASKRCEALARECGDDALGRQAKVLSELIPKRRSHDDVVRNARRTLSENPDDEAANVALGRYFAFVRQDWPKAIPFLLKGASGSLLAAVRAESTPPTTPSKALEVGDLWRELFEKEEDPIIKDQYSGRALYWYEFSLKKAEGFVRLRAAKRLESMPLPSNPMDLIPLVDLGRDTVMGQWRNVEGSIASVPGKSGSCLHLPYAPPEDYDLSLEIERKQGNDAFIVALVLRGVQFDVFLDGWASTKSGLHRLDGQQAALNETTKVAGPFLPLNVPTSVDCSVRGSRVIVKVGEKRIIDWEGDPTRLSLDPFWTAPARDRLAVWSTWNGEFRIHRMMATNVSKFRKVAPVEPSRPKGPPGLVGSWKFDESRGGVANDSSSNRNHGKLQGEVGWTRGRFGGALSFDGRNGYVSAPASGLPAGNQAQTISWWLFTWARPPKAAQVFFSPATAGHLFTLEAGFRDGRLTVWAPNAQILMSTVAPRTGKWTHCAYTFDGRTHRLYVAGRVRASTRVAPTNHKPAQINFGRWTGGGGYFIGALDELRIYNRALTGEEIKALSEGAD